MKRFELLVSFICLRDNIYREILRLEKERDRIKKEEALTKAHFEYEVGKKFLGKIMAKRKARITAEAPTEQSDNLNLSNSTGVEEMTSSNSNYHPIRPEELDVPHVPPSDRFGMQFPPPDPAPTPTIVCPAGFKNMKFVNSFTLKFTPPECCGGPRDVEIHEKDQDKLLCYGRIDSDTEVFLRRENDDKEMEDMLTFKYNLETFEWTISFPELDTVAFLVKPKPASRVSTNQVYEIFSSDACSNYFNLGIELERTGPSSSPDFVFRMLNSNLATVGTVVLLADSKLASVTIDESLWPSQKAVILATAILMAWELVQEIRRKKAWLQVFVVSCIVAVLLIAFLGVNIYFFHMDD